MTFQRFSYNRIPIAREGYPFILLSVALTLASAFLRFSSLTWGGLLLTAFMVAFFRDPDREVPQGDHLITSPADGTVVSIEEAPFPLEMSRRTIYRRVSIFMSIVDVHVNRAPCTGKIVAVHYSPGRFIAAQKAQASRENERNTVVMEEHSTKQYVAMVQVAGLIAKVGACVKASESA